MIGDRPGRLGGGDQTIARRIPFLAVVIVLTFSLFFARLFQLQLIQSDDLRQRSQRNYVRTLRLEAPRGDILDRLGRVLAQTRAAYGLQLVPNDLREPALAYAALGQLIDRDPESLRQKVGSPRGRRRFQPVRLAGDLSYDQFARVESHLYALPGVFTDRRPRRHYVEGSEIENGPLVGQHTLEECQGAMELEATLRRIEAPPLVEGSVVAADRIARSRCHLTTLSGLEQERAKMRDEGLTIDACGLRGVDLDPRPWRPPNRYGHLSAGPLEAMFAPGTGSDVDELARFVDDDLVPDTFGNDAGLPSLERPGLPFTIDFQHHLDAP